MQLPMVAIQTAKCKSLLKIATISISAWAGEDWTFVALWFCVVVKSSGVLGECYQGLIDPRVDKPLVLSSLAEYLPLFRAGLGQGKE